MSQLGQWEAYAAKLAPLAAWDIPDTASGRDLAERIVRRNDSVATIEQAVRLTQRAWASLPKDVRAEALAALQDAADIALASIDQATDLIDAVPIIGQIIGAAIMIIEKSVWVSSELKKGNREISNFAHQRAQFRTIHDLKDPWQWVYSPATCKIYAQYAKPRRGPNWDLKPAFTRPGIQRDRPFLGVASPPDSGDCKKPIRVRLNSYPMNPTSSCERILGISALFFPWWSGAYAPHPLPVWVQESAKANALLIHRQQQLVISPTANLKCPLSLVMEVRDRLLEWWATDQALRPIDGAGNVTGGRGPTIDQRFNPDHIPSRSAAARWYIREDGIIVAYPNQPDSELADWGLPAAPGDPSNLGVTLAQRNIVVSMCAAFAARRQATIRDGKLAAALLTDFGPNPFDVDAIPALEYAASQRKTLPLLGEQPKAVSVSLHGKAKQPARKATPSPARKGSTPTEEDGGAAAAVALGAFLLL